MACYSARVSNPTQSINKLPSCAEDLFRKILDRRWALAVPNTKIHRINLYPRKLQHNGGISFVNETNPLLGDHMVGESKKEPCFYVVRDDLLHPLANGNKARKLDGVLPLIEDHSITDVVTCGGCQSAHTAAVAVACAERGIRSHLLLRGEQPDVLTGYNLVSKMYGNVTYVPRSLYANRVEMLNKHARKMAGDNGSIVWFHEIFETLPKTTSNNLKLPHRVGETSLRKVGIINEGAGDAVALLGVIRLVQYLSQDHLFGRQRALKFVVDAGTGTTAVGLGLAAHLLGLQWEVTAIMLADTIDGYQNQERRLISDFMNLCTSYQIDHNIDGVDAGVVHWVQRRYPRRFGNILEPEIEACQQIAQQTGILVDPVYTLAAWELAALLGEKEANRGADVVMLHTGGTLGLFGLAQRYKSYFKSLKDGVSN